MSTCRNCGRTINFRHIGGRNVPLGCACEPEPRARSASREHFCRQTWCPKCDDSVFFLRHNGGSVWLNDLGWPWPKHECFVDDPDTKQFSKLFVNAPDAKKAQLARVHSTEWWECVKRRVIVFALACGSFPVVFGIDPNDEPKPETVGLLNLKVGTFTDALGSTTRLQGRYDRCKYCNAWVETAAMAEHIAKSHPLWTCPFCKTAVEARFRREHEVVFNCARPRGRWQ